MRGWLALGALWAFPAVSAASPPVVTVGAMGGSAETRALLRRLLIQELGASLGAPRGNVATKPTQLHSSELGSLGTPRFELQGTITRLVRLPDSTGGSLRCDVSLILVEKPGGSVRAFLSGSAHLNGRPNPGPPATGGAKRQGRLGWNRAVEARSDASDVEEAVRIAVRGALRRLPAALGSVGR